MLIKLGLVASLTGRHHSVGEGMFDSLRFIVEKNRPVLESLGMEMNVVAHDDHSTPRGACVAAQRCVDEGCMQIASRSCPPSP